MPLPLPLPLPFPMPFGLNAIGGSSLLSPPHMYIAMNPNITVLTSDAPNNPPGPSCLAPIIEETDWKDAMPEPTSTKEIPSAAWLPSSKRQTGKMQCQSQPPQKRFLLLRCVLLQIGLCAFQQHLFHRILPTETEHDHLRTTGDSE